MPDEVATLIVVLSGETSFRSENRNVECHLYMSFMERGGWCKLNAFVLACVLTSKEAKTQEKETNRRGVNKERLTCLTLTDTGVL